jgi:hypothetical protein
MTKAGIGLIKWTGTALCLVGIGLTSFNIYPLNLFLGFTGSVLWAWAGAKQRDMPLFLVEGAAVVMYAAGILSLITFTEPAKFLFIIMAMVVFLIWKGVKDESKG